MFKHAIASRIASRTVTPDDINELRHDWQEGRNVYSAFMLNCISFNSVPDLPNLLSEYHANHCIDEATVLNLSFLVPYLKVCKHNMLDLCALLLGAFPSFMVACNVRDALACLPPIEQRNELLGLCASLAPEHAILQLSTAARRHLDSLGE
jgi:hypothetical protein